MDLMLEVNIIMVDHIWLYLLGLVWDRLGCIWVEMVGLSYVQLVKPGVGKN